MLIRTLVENKPIELAPGVPIYITDDPALAGKYDNLFVIDTVGETLTESKVTEVPEVPVKKLKRRNAAMYSSSD